MNKEKINKVLYKKDSNDSTYITSKGWYLLNEDNEIQYKIKGPQEIRVFSRKILKEETDS